MTDKKTVLAIDDNVQQLDEYKNMLSANYDLRLVKSAAEAIIFLNRGTADIILLDIEMPNISGFTFLEDIKAIPGYSDVPIIIVSGNSGAEFLERAKNSRASDVLIKPVKQETLINTIERDFN
ncbi:MAG: response regulator [Treponema sp.]|jgi:CheY-like chemotaxis protein|nr:response regulator [Treponema sp.]